MDFYNSLTGRAMPISPAQLLKFTDLDPRVQKHLQKVYTTLTLALAVLCVGITADVFTHVGGLLTTVAGFGALTWLTLTPATPDNLTKRYSLLGAFAFCQGTSLGPLVGLALALQPSVLLTAALATTAIFACFSLSALLTQRRSLLFLGGWLGSAVTGLLLLRLGSWAFGFRAMGWAFDAELYVGLLVFAGYVLFDTQLIVERASAGDFDHVRHALDVFVDFVALAVRVLVVLLRNAEKREAAQRQGSRRRRSDE